MDIKKAPQANLENRRTLFFFVGLSIALLAAITVLQWTSSTFVEKPGDPKERIYKAGPDIPVTIREVAEAPAKQAKAKEKSSADKIKLVDDFIDDVLDDPEPPETEPLGNESTKLKDVDGDDDDPNDLPGVEPVMMPPIVQNMAVPLDCEGLTDKSEQEACLNRWMSKYLRKNVRYPKSARALGIEDKVIVTFIINAEGVVENIRVGNGGNPDLNAEAKRVISELPTFIPASHFGRKVKMSMALPVSFKVR